MSEEVRHTCGDALEQLAVLVGDVVVDPVAYNAAVDRVHRECPGCTPRRTPQAKEARV